MKLKPTYLIFVFRKINLKVGKKITWIWATKNKMIGYMWALKQCFSGLCLPCSTIILCFTYFSVDFMNYIYQFVINKSFFFPGTFSFQHIMYSSLMVWLVNFVIISVFLVRIFVYGEPIMRRKSAVSESFWRHRKQADLCLAKVMCVCFVCMHVCAYACMNMCAVLWML